ncbi:hypothetical protein BU17DRAFT_92241 [Hysterangium stoloniferum]|nr:hypothetical protein BU17DRAFT_92241 [Hysterangium stoloniferum]
MARGHGRPRSISEDPKGCAGFPQSSAQSNEIDPNNIVKRQRIRIPSARAQASMNQVQESKKKPSYSKPILLSVPEEVESDGTALAVSPDQNSDTDFVPEKTSSIHVGSLEGVVHDESSEEGINDNRKRIKSVQLQSISNKKSALAVEDIQLNVPSWRSGTISYSLLVIPSTTPYPEIIEKIFAKAKASECKARKRPHISVVMSMNKRVPCSLDNEEDWARIVANYRKEVTKKGDDAFAEVKFPDKFLQDFSIRKVHHDKNTKPSNISKSSKKTFSSSTNYFEDETDTDTSGNGTKNADNTIRAWVLALIDSPNTVTVRQPPKVPLFKDFHHDFTETSEPVRRQGAHVVRMADLPNSHTLPPHPTVPNIILNLPHYTPNQSIYRRRSRHHSNSQRSPSPEVSNRSSPEMAQTITAAITVQEWLEKLHENGTLSLNLWESLLKKFEAEDSLQLTLDRLATLTRMEVKAGFSFTMFECITVYEELCKAAKEMGFHMVK